MRDNPQLLQHKGYGEILDKLSTDRDYWVRDAKPLNVTMCGLLFARP
jgi:hypothetical protein